jgi:hypothetical protein
MVALKVCNRHFILIWVILISLPFSVAGQQDSSGKSFSYLLYGEAYYSYDFMNPEDKLRPPFLYSFNRHNIPAVNLALAKASFNTSSFRANAGLMAGTYSTYNLANENGILKNIYELNIGARLGKVWLDGGVMNSHIGIESPIGQDNWHLTRSLMADNSPYFETGVRLSYQSPSGKWYAAVLGLNGWQRIRPIEGNILPSFGHQVQFKPNGRWTWNSSSFIGTDVPDSVRTMRYFHDLYAIFQLNEKIGLQGAFDVGIQQESKGSNVYDCWYTGMVALRHAWHPHWRYAIRLEYFRDQGGVVAKSETGAPLAVFGCSANIDREFFKRLWWRSEARWFGNEEPMFREGTMDYQGNFALTTSVSIRF